MAKGNKTSTKAAGRDKGKEPKGQPQSAEASPGIGGRIAQFREFFEQSQVEIKKVVWPSRKETMATSIAVVVVVIVMGLYLFGVDALFSKIVQVILSA